MIDPAAEQLHREYEHEKKHGSIEFTYRDGKLVMARRMETIKLDLDRNDRRASESRAWVLTTADSNKIGGTPVTDQNANIAIPSEKARVISPDFAILMNASIVARPLMTPEVSSIKVKDLGYQYRWVNRDGQGGQIYQQRRTQGFLNATLNDVEVLGGDAETRDGEIRAGDLILMKIRKDLYEGAMKYNMQKAMSLQGARGVFKEGGSSDVMSDDVAQTKTIAETQGAVTRKAEPFIPKNVDSMLNDSEQSGRAEQARKTNSELGKK